MKRNWIPRRQEGVWRIACYQVGMTAEKIKYRIPTQIANNREKTRREIARQERRQTQGIRAICRTVNASFYRDNGYLLELTVSDAGLQKLMKKQEALLRARAQGGAGEENREKALRDAMQHEMELWLRRVKRERAKAGAQVKYWGVVSQKDGKTGLPARIHCHVIVDQDALAECVRKWTLGAVLHERLWDEPDHNDLVAYLLQQVEAGENEKRYTPSRNLTRPEPAWERTVYTDAELRLPAGCSLITRDEVRRGMPQYIRYILPMGQNIMDEDEGGVDDEQMQIQDRKREINKKFGKRGKRRTNGISANLTDVEGEKSRIKACDI